MDLSGVHQVGWLEGSGLLTTLILWGGVPISRSSSGTGAVMEKISLLEIMKAISLVYAYLSKEDTHFMNSIYVDK